MVAQVIRQDNKGSVNHTSDHDLLIFRVKSTRNELPKEQLKFPWNDDKKDEFLTYFREIWSDSQIVDHMARLHEVLTLASRKAGLINRHKGS